MLSFSAWTSQMRGRLGTSSLEDWASYIQESCPTAATSPTSLAFWRLYTWLASPCLQDLVAAFMCYVMFLLVLAYVFILLTLWGTAGSAFGASLTAASHWESGLGIWMARRPSCYQPPLCDELSNTFLEGRSSLKFETQEVDDAYAVRHST